MIYFNDRQTLDRFAKNLVAQTLILNDARWNVDDIHEECQKIVKAWVNTQEFLKVHVSVLPTDLPMQDSFNEYLFDKIEYILNTLRTLVLTQDF